MVEVAPRSGPIRIDYWKYVALLLLLLLLGLAVLWAMLDTQWGASNSMSELFRKYLASVNRFRPNARPEDNLASALRIHGVEKLEGRKYAMFFTVTDGNSEPQNVTKNQVTIAVGDPGAAIKTVVVDRVNPLQNLKTWNDRLSFAAVMDYSGSMFPEDLDAIESNYTYFINNLAFPFAAAVIKFHSVVEDILNLSSNQTDVEAALKRRIPLGNTALYNGICRGVEKIKNRPHLRMIILTTDGNNNVPGNTLDEAIQVCRQNFISNVVMGFGWLKVEILRRISDETDGFYVYVPDSSELKNWFPKIAKIVNNVQVAEFVSPIDIQPASSIEITVNVGGSTLKRSR